MTTYQKIREAVDAVRSRSKVEPEIGIVLGSGLGSIAEQIQDAVIVPYVDIPYFHGTSVEGHAGQLIVGTFQGTPTVALQGRFHLYEGYGMEDVVFPTRTVCGLGIKTLVLTNAAGGVNTRFRPGDLMAIEDHLNLMGDNPLKGPNLAQLGPRFPDLSEPYSRRLLELAAEVGSNLKLSLRRGVYAAVLGPNLETRAEYLFLRLIGADLVGMSTIPEILVGIHRWMEILGIACVTDRCDPDHLEPVDIKEIIRVANEAGPEMDRLIEAFIKKLATSCDAAEKLQRHA